MEHDGNHEQSGLTHGADESQPHSPSQNHPGFSGAGIYSGASGHADDGFPRTDSYTDDPLLPKSSSDLPSARDGGFDDTHGEMSYIEENRMLDAEAKGTIVSSTINIANTIIGSGMLAMVSICIVFCFYRPELSWFILLKAFAIASVGLIPGVILVVFSAVCSGYGLHLLAAAASCCKVPRRSSFFNVSLITYPSAAVFFDVAIAIKCLGVGISYLIICGDIMPEVARAIVPDQSGNDLSSAAKFFVGPEGCLYSPRFWITVFTILVVSPLSFLRRLDSLRYASLVALGAAFYLAFLVIYFFAHAVADTDPETAYINARGVIMSGLADFEWVKMSIAFLYNLPIFIFSYTCHQNMFSVHNELRVRTPAHLNRIIVYSVGSATFLYQLVGVLGYLTFGPTVGSNIIKMCK